MSEKNTKGEIPVPNSFEEELSNDYDNEVVLENVPKEEPTETDEEIQMFEETDNNEGDLADEVAAKDETEKPEILEEPEELVNDELSKLGAAGVAAGLIEKTDEKGKTKKPKKPKAENKYTSGIINNIKSFNLKGFSKGMRGKITILAIIVSLVPMICLSGLNMVSQSKVIKENIAELNTAVNKGLVEKIDADVSSLIKTLKLVPETTDLMVLQSSDQERVLRKITSNDNIAYREVMLTDKSGLVISGTDNKLVGMNNSDKKWYAEAIAGKAYVSDAYKDPKTKLPVFDIAVPVLDTSRNPNGVLYAKVALDKIQKTIKETKVGESGVAYIVDKKGIVLAHPEYKRMVMEGYNTVTNKIEGPSLIAQGKTGQSTYKNADGELVEGTYYTIPSTGWGLITEISVDEAMRPVTSARNFSIALMLIAVVVVLVASVYMALRIAAPLVQMVGIADEIKKGRFTNKIKVKGNDEIAKLQESFNEMSESLSGLLREVDGAASNISIASEKMTDGTHTASAAVEEITAIVEDVANGAVEQISSVDEAVLVVKEISRFVEEAASKTTEVAEKASKAAIVAQQGSENIQIISEKVNGIKENVISNSELVGKLGEKSAQVGETVKSIREIAGKTNMLALNAAIEAARAGEAGRGFAVVANEIRSLAEQTREASKSIESLLTEIQRDSIATVESMSIGITEVEAGTEAIASTYGTFSQIIDDVQLVAKEVMEVSSTVLNLQQENSKVVEAVMKVEAIAQSTSSGTQNVLASTEEQASSTQEIATLASDLSVMAVQLKNMINKFEFDRNYCTPLPTEKETELKVSENETENEPDNEIKEI